MNDEFINNRNYVPRAFISADVPVDSVGWVDIRSLTKPFMDSELITDLNMYTSEEVVLVSYALVGKRDLYYEDIDSSNNHAQYSGEMFKLTFKELVKLSNAQPNYNYVTENESGEEIAITTNYFKSAWEDSIEETYQIKVEDATNNLQKEKEPKKMSLLDKLKTSSFSAAKTAASTTLAEKITDLVLERLPAPVRAIADKLPRYISVVLVSSAVHAAAERFDIPGKNRVKEVSAYAIDGAFYEFSKGIMKSLIPLFDAIRNMAPEDLTRLEEEARSK